MDIIDPRYGWPLAAPVKGGFDVGFLTLKDGFHGTVALLPYPARYLEMRHSPASLHAKTDPLDPAGNDGVGSDGIFHKSPFRCSIDLTDLPLSQLRVRVTTEAPTRFSGVLASVVPSSD